MKIVHISDLQIGYDKNNCKKRAEKIVSGLIKRCKPASDYIIVLTGDIVDKGKKSGQFETAKTILDKLTSAGLQLLIVPENYDYDSGRKIKKVYQEKFNATFYGDSNFKFPICNIINQTAFIGLDSMPGELENSRSSLAPDGLLGKKQLKHLKEFLLDAEVMQCQHRVVYLHHHPFYKDIFWIMALKDEKGLEKVLKEFDIGLLLFGHKHDGDILSGEKWGIPRIFDGGSSTGIKMDKATPVRLIDLEKSSNQYQEWKLL